MARAGPKRGRRKAGDGAPGPLPEFIPDLGPPKHVYSNIAERVLATDCPRTAWYVNAGMTELYGFNQIRAANYFYRASQLSPKEPFPLFGSSYAVQMNFNHLVVSQRYMVYCIECFLLAKQLCASLGRTCPPITKRLVHALRARTIQKASAPFDKVNLSPSYPQVQKNMTRWSARMAEVFRSFPNDADVCCLYASSLMMYSPWKWWPDGSLYVPPTDLTQLQQWRGRNKEKAHRMMDVLGLLERARRLDPRNIGALHYTIHAVEESPYPQLGLSAAEALEQIIARNGPGHLLHMPAHIYQRVGLYERSIAANLAAVAADRKLFKEYQERALEPSSLVNSFYFAEYTAHNMHFMIADAVMLGRYGFALEWAKKLETHVCQFIHPDSGQNTFLEHFLCVKPHVLLLARKFRSVLALRSWGASYPQLEAEVAFCKTIAHIQLGQKDEAWAALRTFLRLNRHFMDTKYTSGEACRCGCQKRHGGIVNPHFGMNKYSYARGNPGAIAKLELKQRGLPSGPSLTLHHSKILGRIRELLAQGCLEWFFNSRNEALAAFEAATDAYENLQYDEPSDYIRPVHETYAAALLLEGKRADAARIAYRGQIPYPNNPRLSEIIRLAEDDTPLTHTDKRNVLEML